MQMMQPALQVLAGIANTKQLKGIYVFDDDNFLEYSASIIATSGDVTITELPTNTVMIFGYISGVCGATGGYAQFALQAASGSAEPCVVFESTDNPDGGSGTEARISGGYIARTNGKSIHYIVDADTTINIWNILGYAIAD